VLSVEWVVVATAGFMWGSLVILTLMVVLSLFDLVLLVKQRSALVVWSLALKAVVLVWFVLYFPSDVPFSASLGYLMPLLVFSAFALPAGLCFIVLDGMALKRQWNTRTGWHGI
jgi:hypothetical protein